MSTPFISRLERLGSVESTQPVVRDWLDAGTPEVCLAVADEQTQGRGRLGRTRRVAVPMAHIIHQVHGGEVDRGTCRLRRTPGAASCR